MCESWFSCDFGASGVVTGLRNMFVSKSDWKFQIKSSLPPRPTSKDQKPSIYAVQIRVPDFQTSHKLKQPQSQWNHILKSHHPLLTTKLIFATLVLKSAAATLTLQNCNFFTNSILHRHSRGYRKKAGTFSADVDLAVGKQTMTQTQQQ